LAADPGTDASFATVRALRTAVAAVPGSGALVGGAEATDLDARVAAARDQRVIIPLVLAVVLVVLLLVLGSVVAAGLLPALDIGVPLLSFLFLVALGVDYNIFLTTRAREEAQRTGTRAGIVTTFAVTGGVTTSAGLLLAAVFAVLGVLPLITLTQLGVIVGFGVLIDTLLVRSVLVPALVALVGDQFWWPSNPVGVHLRPSAVELTTAPEVPAPRT